MYRFLLILLSVVGMATDVYKRQMQQTVEFHQHIRIIEFPGDELAVIETLAEVQDQLDIAHNDGVLKFIVPFLEFIPRCV